MNKLVQTEWLKLPKRFNDIELHEFVIMPNHFHAILEIVGATLVVAQNTEMVAQNTEMVDPQKGQPQGIAPTGGIYTNKTIGDFVGAFKSIVTLKYINGVKNMGWKQFDGKLFQRNYYENIIRNEQSYNRILEYIINNPTKWSDDKLYKV